MTAPQTWLPTEQAARAAGITTKALRRRIERGTVESELRDDGRRYVLLASVDDGGPAPAPPRRDPGIEPLLARLEELSAENGRLRALTQIAESTEQRLADELHEERARARTAQARADELEDLERDLAAAGPIRAWRLARQRRRRDAPVSSAVDVGRVTSR